MRLPLNLALAAVCMVFASCARAPAPVAAPDPALWRIADADSEIWLLGTVHVLPPELDWMSPRVAAALAAADELVLETDASAAAQPAFARLAAALGHLPAGETLATRLDAPTYSRLTRVAGDLGVSADDLSTLRPWLAALRLSLAAALRGGRTPEAGAETVLRAAADARALPITYLESAEQQVRTLADLSPADEHRLLAATLAQIEDGSNGADEFDRAWAGGDADAMAAALAADWAEAGDGAYQAVIVRRNQAWVEEIARRLDGEGRIFIAVGVAHLVGPDSVVSDLRARGMDVEGP